MAFVLCLDTLADSDELYMHVSRPPKPDTPMHSFTQQLEEVMSFYCKMQNMEYSYLSLHGLKCVFAPPGGVLQISLGEGGIGPQEDQSCGVHSSVGARALQPAQDTKFYSLSSGRPQI